METIVKNYESYIGHKDFKKSNKPFKSGENHNTVKGIANHEILNVPAFIFEEDDSSVRCETCQLVEKLYE